MKKDWTKEVVQQRINRRNYPASPSAGPGIMRIFKKYFEKTIRGIDKPTVIVFGATPELRDLALEENCRLITIDASQEMVERLSPLMKHQRNPDEKILIRDWLDNFLPDSSADVLLGDGVANNIAFKDQERFMQEIKRLVKQGGYVILRETVIGPQRRIHTVEEIDDDFCHGKIHWFDLFLDLRFYADISQKFYNKKRRALPMMKMYKELEKAYQQGRLSKKSYQRLLGFRSPIVHTHMSWSEMTDFFAKYFRSLPIEQAKDYKFTKDTFVFFFGKVQK